MSSWRLLIRSGLEHTVAELLLDEASNPELVARSSTLTRLI